MKSLNDLTEAVFEKDSTGRLSILLQLFSEMREKTIIPTEQIALQIYIALIKAELGRRLD